MLVCLIFLFVAAFFAKFSFFDFTAFFGLTRDFNREMILIMAPIGGLSVPLFVGMTYLVKYINKKLADKKLKFIDKFDGEGAK